jgi:hypothetical protein
LKRYSRSKGTGFPAVRVAPLELPDHGQGAPSLLAAVRRRP